MPDIFGLENKVYTTARSFVNRSDSGSQAQGNQAQGNQAQGSQAGGGTPAGSGAAGTDPAAGSPADAAGAQTLVLGDRIAAAPPVVAGAAAPDLSMIPAQNGSTAQGAPSAALIAPAAASGVNGPVGLSAMIIVIATATVVGAGVVQLRVMQLRRAAG
ncbi:MAG: hypothetical protein M3Z02_07980 [Actinomycetota bacterium]|nr:hypothetical protein [Actinomycetota bacterium]